MESIQRTLFLNGEYSVPFESDDRKRHSKLSGLRFNSHSNRTSSRSGAMVDSGDRIMWTPSFELFDEEHVHGGSTAARRNVQKNNNFVM